MRLIETSSLQFEEFLDDDVPDYAILSHTWGKEEVSFEAFTKPESLSLAGYKKIERCCSLAISDGWDYVWIDTCCIDKKSSAELSEAINSMYNWYKNASVCYAYLADVTIEKLSFHNEDGKAEEFRKSRWFTRGWTLQELLAPASLTFYNSDWNKYGTRASLEAEISHITKISRSHLKQPTKASIAQKMSWVSRRQTSRREDIAYCLLGLFDINMPLLYGEGEKAFMRLQYEIIKVSNDESIFAWTNENLWSSGMLARSPACFLNSGDVVPIPSRRPPYTMTNSGLDIQLNLSVFELKSRYAYCSANDQMDLVTPLTCARLSEKGSSLVVRLRSTVGQNGANVAMRTHLHRLEALARGQLKGGSLKRFLVQDVINQKSVCCTDVVQKVIGHASRERNNHRAPTFGFEGSATIGRDVILFESIRDTTRYHKIFTDTEPEFQAKPLFLKFHGRVVSRCESDHCAFAISWGFTSLNQVYIKLHYQIQAGHRKSGDMSSEVIILEGNICTLPHGGGRFVWVELAKDRDTEGDEDRWILHLDLTEAGGSSALELM